MAQRKAGTTVACPKCGEPNVVPGSSAGIPVGSTSTAAPASAEAFGQAVTAIVAEPPPAQAEWLPPAVSVEAAAFDDIVHLLSDKQTVGGPSPSTSVQPALGPSPTIAAASSAPPAPPAPPPIPAVPAFEARVPGTALSSSRSTATRRTRHDDGAVLLITRRAVYAQATLAAVMLSLSFAAGFVIGRSGRVESKTTADKAESGEPVALDGYVLYSLTPGESLPDAGATVIALPAGKKPSQKIAARGLRPGEQDDLSAAPAAEALRSLGAAVARTDSSGQFQIVVPKPGEYALVILSHRANRPEGQTIAMSDQEELSRVFASPKELVGQKRYTITSRRLAGAPPAFTHEFGPTDKK